MKGKVGLDEEKTKWRYKTEKKIEEEVETRKKTQVGVQKGKNTSGREEKKEK